jgi:hypothetical protein
VSQTIASKISDKIKLQEAGMFMHDEVHLLMLMIVTKIEQNADGVIVYTAAKHVYRAKVVY